MLKSPLSKRKINNFEKFGNMLAEHPTSISQCLSLAKHLENVKNCKWDLINELLFAVCSVKISVCQEKCCLLNSN